MVCRTFWYIVTTLTSGSGLQISHIFCCRSAKHVAFFIFKMTGILDNEATTTLEEVSFWLAGCGTKYEVEHLFFCPVEQAQYIQRVLNFPSGVLTIAPPCKDHSETGRFVYNPNHTYPKIPHLNVWSPVHGKRMVINSARQCRRCGSPNLYGHKQPLRNGSFFSLCHKHCAGCCASAEVVMPHLLDWYTNMGEMFQAPACGTCFEGRRIWVPN